MSNLLYHGTSEVVARKALTEGLLPRGQTNSKGNWGHTVDSSKRTVHLTKVYAPYFAFTASIDNTNWGIVEVDLDRLNESSFLPDEDFLEQVTRNDPDYEEAGSDMIKRTKWFRDNIDDFAANWKLSLDSLGTMAHLGPVPPEAITRVCIVKEMPHAIRIGAIDPNISLLNYQFCEEKYKALTRWCIGDDIEISELYGAHWHLIDDVAKEGTLKAFKDFSDREVILSENVSELETHE